MTEKYIKQVVTRYPSTLYRITGFGLFCLRTNAEGFPSQGRAVVVDGSTEDEFTWTGKTSNTLTGCSGFSDHTDTGLTVKITGAMLHKQLLALKQEKEFFTFTDIDGLTYTVLFNDYQSGDFVINQEDGIENNVPITLLES